MQFRKIIALCPENFFAQDVEFVSIYSTGQML
jgi:hypothetical protein